jgi:hypothetical protein
MTFAPYATPSFRARAQVEPNPFIPIPDIARLFIVAYVLIWRVIPSVAILSIESTVSTGYALGIALARLGTELLLLLPFLLRRFAGTPIGWLHPLVIIPLISIGFGIIRNPSRLLEPVTIWGRLQTLPMHELLTGWPAEDVLRAQLLMNSATLLASACTLVGFSLFRMRMKPAKGRLTLSGLRLTVVFLILVAIVLFFLQMQGGVLNHMASLAGGRFRMRETSGQFLVLNAVLPYLAILWYLYRPNTIRSPVFLAAFGIAVVLQFVVTGSRSSLFVPVAALLCAWMFVNRRVPATRALLLGVAAVLLLNALGEVRRSGRDGEVDFTALLELNLTEAWDASQAELVARSRNPSLAVFALVPQEVDHIYGVTYLAAVGFMIPRAIWRTKPRGGGAYAAALLFNRLPTAEGYRGASYPIGGPAEAYWSFHLPGVVLIFLIYGALLRLIVDWVRRDPRNPIAILVLILIVFVLDDPNTDGLVSFLQQFTLVMFAYLVVASRVR